MRAIRPAVKWTADAVGLVQRSAALRRAGVFTCFVLLETRISRFRNFSTEDGIPAWRKAVVGGWLFIRFCFYVNCGCFVFLYNSS